MEWTRAENSTCGDCLCRACTYAFPDNNRLSSPEGRRWLLAPRDDVTACQLLCEKDPLCGGFVWRRGYGAELLRAGMGEESLYGRESNSLWLNGSWVDYGSACWFRRSTGCGREESCDADCYTLRARSHRADPHVPVQKRGWKTESQTDCGDCDLGSNLRLGLEIGLEFGLDAGNPWLVAPNREDVQVCRTLCDRFLEKTYESIDSHTSA